MPKFTMRDVLNGIAAEQERAGASAGQDALLSYDIGGAVQIARGKISHIAEGDEVVTLWRTLYTLSGRDLHHPKATRWPEHKVPTNAHDVWHAEIPMHIRLDRIVVVEWAENDYS